MKTKGSGGGRRVNFKSPAAAGHFGMILRFVFLMIYFLLLPNDLDNCCGEVGWRQQQVNRHLSVSLFFSLHVRIR